MCESLYISSPQKHILCTKVLVHMSILLWNLVYELHDGDKHYKRYFLYNILVISKKKEVLDFFPLFPLQFSFFYKL
jgi:hypothetical protein